MLGLATTVTGYFDLVVQVKIGIKKKHVYGKTYEGVGN